LPFNLFSRATDAVVAIVLENSPIEAVVAGSATAWPLTEWGWEGWRWSKQAVFKSSRRGAPVQSCRGLCVLTQQLETGRIRWSLSADPGV